MGVLKAHIKPFDTDGNYAADFIEVTRDVTMNSIKSINQSLDNNEYNIGIYRPTNFTVKMNNSEGAYSDVTNLESIFNLKRNESLFKIEWALNDRPMVSGQSVAGDIVQSVLSPDIALFTGLLNDESLAMDLDRQENNFRVLGRESIFKNVLTPFSALSAGDTLEELIFACLNQLRITDILTLTAGNINVGTDAISDSVAWLENKTVKEALDILLLITNTVLYVDGDNIIAAPRTATADVQKTFYGQGSFNGIDNILDIKNIKNGVGRVFNYFVWGSTVVQDSSSILTYGLRKKEFDSTLVTDTTKRTNLMTPIMNEFRNAKQEFDLFTPMDYSTIALKLLDRVSIDYPNVFLPQENELPLYDKAVYGVDKYPEGLFSFVINDFDHYKILERRIGFNNGFINFHCREI